MQEEQKVADAAGAGLAQHTTLREVVIDLADGGGVQVFRAESDAALVASLAEAQTNATRKIREQALQLRAFDKAPNLTEDEKQTLASSLVNDFSAAVGEYVAAVALQKAHDDSEARKAEQAREEQEANDLKEFIESTPSYHATPRNAKKLVRWLQFQGLQVTAENLRAAFEDLDASGLLERRRTVEALPASPQLLPEQPAASDPVRRKLVGGGMVFNRRGPAPQRQRLPDPERMTTDELRTLAIRSMSRL